MKLYDVILNCCNSSFYNLFLSAQQIGFVTRKSEGIRPLFRNVSHFSQIWAETRRDEKLQEQGLRKHAFF